MPVTAPRSHPHRSATSALLARDRVIVVKLEGVRALIAADEMFIPQAQADIDDVTAATTVELRRRLAAMGVQDEAQALVEGGEAPPFELRCLEAVLEAVCSRILKGAAAVEG